MKAGAKDPPEMQPEARVSAPCAFTLRVVFKSRVYGMVRRARDRVEDDCCLNTSPRNFCHRCCHLSRCCSNHADECCVRPLRPYSRMCVT